MNFEELSLVWKENISKTGIEVNQKLLKEINSITIKNKLAGTKWSSIFEIAMNYLWAFYLIEFIVEKFYMFKFSLPAIILLLIAFYSVVFEAYKLVLYYSINNQLSILETQQKLERLKYLELFDSNSLYFIIPAFFIPFVVVFSMMFLRIDIYALGFSGLEIMIGTSSSFVIGIIIVFFIKKYPSKALEDSIEFLQELRDIQKENKSSMMEI